MRPLRKNGQLYLQRKCEAENPARPGAGGPYRGRRRDPFAHWGCKGTIGASSLIKNSLENAGLPTMVLDGDGCNPANSSDGQVSTRLQAYLEMLSEGKEGKRS